MNKDRAAHWVSHFQSRSMDEGLLKLSPEQMLAFMRAILQARK
jgi:hypothetical protein